MVMSLEKVVIWLVKRTIVSYGKKSKLFLEVEFGVHFFRFKVTI